MRRRTGLLVVVLSALVAGCSSQAGSRPARGDAKVITTAEMDASGHTDAFALVQALRPQWLRIRGRASIAKPETIWVYLDGAQLGGPNHLRNMATHAISSLQYFDGLEASQRWGLDHGAGAIVVSTRGR
ncbi:MAG: hypothetical protein KFH98_09270 [Gemmatimonadetes bacterium]|nr:hypothetical protein [Gemmatimonadota bacterium]